MPQSSPLLRSRLFISKWDNSTTNPNNTMFQLSSDEEFHFELLRVLAMAPYEGSDIGETLLAINNVVPGSFDSFTATFTDLAARTSQAARAINAAKHPVSARQALFRAATYYRSADFFVRANWSDPRIISVWASALDAFQGAVKLYPHPARTFSIPTAHGFAVPGYFFPAAGPPGRRRPTLILGNGYDGSQEEMWHVAGAAARERGINVVLYEGPGQATVRRAQGVGFVPQWERVVTPLLDWVLQQPEVDPGAVGLLGLSFGGYLAPRAAAFEHRLAAVIAIDGMHDFGAAIIAPLAEHPVLGPLWAAGNATAFDRVLLGALPSLPTQPRWFFEQGMWAFNTPSPFAMLTQLKAYNLTADVAKGIRCPAFIADADHDAQFAGQGKALAGLLGEKATYHLFKAADGAGEHCSLGASVMQNQVVLDWFMDVIGKSEV